jgi:hypothetical protein
VLSTAATTAPLGRVFKSAFETPVIARVVVVALVVVAFVPVNDWKVEEPVVRRFVREVRPATVRVPVRLDVAPIV